MRAVSLLTISLPSCLPSTGLHLRLCRFPAISWGGSATRAMARSKTDLPSMQPAPRRRMPLSRGFNFVSQVIGKYDKSDVPPVMMRQYDLIERVRGYNPDTDEA